MKYFSYLALAGLCLVGGCMSDAAPDSKTPTNFSLTAVPSYDFALSPTELVEKIKQSLATMGITIAQQNGTVLITNYKNYPGSFHIVRRWHERTRYRIAITPDAYEPMRRSHLEITSESQTRATGQEPWHTWAEYQRPQRAAMLAKTLHDHIQGNGSASETATPVASIPAQTALPAGAESVMVIYHVLPGKEAELKADLAKAWQIYQRENLVVPEPHVLVKDHDSKGETSFIEEFSWVDHQAADRVPESVKNLWDQMHACCEDRDGHPGIDSHEVTSVDLPSPR